MTRRGFFGACFAAAAAMVLPATKAAGVDVTAVVMPFDVNSWLGPRHRLICVWRGRIVMTVMPNQPTWFMSQVSDPANFKTG